MIRRMVGWVVVATLVLASASVVLAQLPVGTILGEVRDTSGGLVPDVTVTALNLETAQSRTVTSGENGAYRFSALPAGRYEIRVEKTGFQTDVRTGVTLSVAQEAVLNFDLQVGGVEQQVIVSGEAPQVNTTSGSLGGLVDDKRILELPLNGRNFVDLTLLQPGITEHRNVGANPTSVGLWYSSNGAPIRSNNILIDGAPMTSFLGANSSSVSGGTLGLDGIREYRIITNAFSAEYGMTMGSQVTIVSKGGSNGWHGDVFEYIRNSALDARNFFDTAASSGGKRLPEFKRNNFGGAFGGPIKRDKTFFHFAYEGLRQRLGQTIVDNVMAAQCHDIEPNGSGAYRFVSDASAKACASTLVGPGGVGTVSVIPSVIVPLLAVYPNPNLPGNQFTYPFTAPTRDDYAQLRVDHTFSTSDSLFARYTFDDAHVIGAVTTAAGLQSYPGYTVDSRSRSQFATVSETHVFSSSMINTARFSYGRTAPRNDSRAPYVGPQYGFIPGNGSLELGNINIGGLSALGPHVTTPAYLPQNVFTWSDDVFYTKGRHSFKFGTLINRYQLFDETARGYRGTAVFANVANFVRGIVQNYSGLTPGSNTARNYRFTTMGFYLQDDYRILSRLTLNLGLRYEFMTQFHEKDGIQASVRNLATDSGPTIGVPFKNPTMGNVSPRVGFAWDVMGNGRTAVRGGFALLYDLSTYGTGLNVIQPNAQPFSSGSTVLNPTNSPAVFTVPFTFTSANIGNTMSLFDYNMQQPHLLSYNLAIERQLPYSMALSVAYAGSRGINILGTRDGNPRIPNGIPSGTSCIARPAGQALDLTSMVDGVATACWLATPTGQPNPNPFVNTSIPASISLITGTSNSFYNALQVMLSKRLSRGLQFQSSYTFSRLIDTPQSEATQVVSSSPVQPTDAFNAATDRGLSAYDITHNWRFNVTYQFPQMASAGSFLGKVVNGWQTSSIVSMQNGYPFTVNVQANASRSGAFQGLQNLDRPNLVPGRSIDSITSGVSTGVGCATEGQALGTPKLWFDPCAFTPAAAGFLGNAGRNILRGPRLTNVDFSIVKNTAVSALGEAGRVEFRTEFFNLFNHANFAMPVRTAFVSTTGRINSAATSRQIQFALKVVF